MRTDNSVFDKERREQSTVWLFFFAIVGAAGALIVYVFGWTPTTFVLMPILVAAALTRRATLKSEFEKRLTLLAFKTHIGNLYVSDKFPDDDSTIGRRDFAIAMLKESGNAHHVRVYSVMFRDVVVFCHWWDGETLRMAREFRNDGTPATESWEQYIAFLHDLRDKKETDFMRTRRKDSTGDDWLNQHFFKQMT